MDGNVQNDLAPTEPENPENGLAQFDGDDWPWPSFPRKAARNYERKHSEQFTGWEGDFLEGVRNSGICRSACAHARVPYTLVQRRRERDPQFAKAYKEAQAEAVDLMEAAAWQRAIKGTTRRKPHWNHGKLYEAVITEFSDSVLIFLLKANRPEKYREQIDHTHNIQIVEEEARRLARENGLDEERVLSEARRILGL